jgi:hypothetical protein
VKPLRVSGLLEVALRIFHGKDGPQRRSFVRRNIAKGLANLVPDAVAQIGRVLTFLVVTVVESRLTIISLGIFLESLPQFLLLRIAAGFPSSVALLSCGASGDKIGCAFGQDRLFASSRRGNLSSTSEVRRETSFGPNQTAT